MYNYKLSVIEKSGKAFFLTEEPV